MQVNSIDKHDFRGSDDLCCRANCLADMVALFLMMQDHEEPSLDESRDLLDALLERRVVYYTLLSMEVLVLALMQECNT
jgi:hypothetical protein